MHFLFTPPAPHDAELFLYIISKSGPSSVVKCKLMLTESSERAQVCYHVVADAVIGQRVEHAAESRRPGRRADQILQDQVPADEKRHKLSDRHVAVGVGRAGGFRHPDTKLCVAHTWKENTHIAVHTNIHLQLLCFKSFRSLQHESLNVPLQFEDL